jgi:hypothetical protein
MDLNDKAIDMMLKGPRMVSTSAFYFMYSFILGFEPKTSSWPRY